MAPVADPVWKLKMPAVHDSVVHMLAEAAAGYPHREALVCGDTRLSYVEFLRCVGGLASELGRDPETAVAGERVALVMGNSADLCIAYIATFGAGGQAVPLEPACGEQMLADLLADAAPRAVVYDEAAHGTVEPIADRLAVPTRLIVGAGARRLTAWRELSTFAHFLPTPVSKELAVLQYDGGAPAPPRGIDISHSAIATNLAQRQALAPVRRAAADADAERILCALPLTQPYAAAMCLYTAVQCQGTLVMAPRLDPTEILRVIAEERISMFPGNRALLADLMAQQDFDAADLSSLRVTISDNPPLPENLSRRWEKATGAPVLDIYGRPEGGPVLTLNPLDGKRKSGSAGICAPLTEFQIVDPETGAEALPPRKRGEIIARGPQIMAGYRERPEDTATALRDGWLYTGDLGEYDKDGYLYVHGRRDEQITVSGRTVFPRDVEDVLYSHPAVRDVGVVGATAKSGKRRQIVKAFVVLKPGATATAEDLLAHCRAKLPKYKSPSEIELLADFPRAATGEIDRESAIG